LDILYIIMRFIQLIFKKISIGGVGWAEDEGIYTYVPKGTANIAF